MIRSIGRRAVVIGGGIGGLAAAGALANYFEHVEVLERDRLPESASPRSGTPQDRHPHGLLAGGLKALGDIFPGFERDLAEAGAIPVRLMQDLQYERVDVGVLPRRDFGLSIFCASRPLIEAVLRRRVLAVANITVRSECRVTAIVPLSVGEGIRGVRFDLNKASEQTLGADLVVDASGRGALTLAFLDELGWKRPEVTEVGVDISYATAVVQIPADAPPEWKLVLTLPNPPTVSTNAVLTPVEDNRWLVAIANYGATARPETWNGFLDASLQLTTPTLHNALRGAKPPESIRHYAFPTSSWRHFERLPMPRGVLPIADALCRFNPIYAQGMSSAAKQARLLQLVLEQRAADPDPLMATQLGFMAEVGALLETPWGMSTRADLALPATRGERPEHFEQALQFEAALFRAAVADPVVHRAMLEVFQLLKPHTLLREPHIMERIEDVSSKM